MSFRPRRTSLSLIAPCAALCLAGSALAQSTGSITGSVLDPTGAVVPNAQIRVVGIATGVERTAV